MKDSDGGSESRKVSEIGDVRKPGTHELNILNQKRYAVTAWFYDILDCPWERQYRKWRPELLKDLRGEVLEAGVGTGRNLKYYGSGVNLTAVDFSPAMLRKASKRCTDVSCTVQFIHEDASRMVSIPSGCYDWVVAFFLCCVLPDDLQDQTIFEFARVLKPGGRFRLLEMRYSDDPKLRKRQNLFAPFVAKVYGAGFDRQTLMHIQENANLKVTRTRYIKKDTYLVIEGVRNI
jgi:ubiquinone/menaquinone biosynthesis C-methylase UbiE